MSAKPPDPIVPHRLISPWGMRLVLLALTALTLIIHGYHPLSEDGGLYLAGVQFKLNPTLFPHYTAFVTEHFRFSCFAPATAAFIRISHLPFAWAVLFIDIFSIWLTFYAAQKILTRCFASPAAQLAGLCLLSALWTLPIAGTSLYLMDPYVTARSLSTPLSLLAIAFALGPWHGSRPQPLLYCAVMLFAAAIFHPLMAAYAFALVIVIYTSRLRARLLGWTTLLALAIAFASTLHLIAPSESPSLIAAEITRYYWFLSQWHWFELLGIAGPLAVFAALCSRFLRRPSPRDHNALTLCRASIVTGLIATIIALFFAHQNSATHLVARLQPLRVFLLLYAVMVILLGATLMELTLQARRKATTHLYAQALTATSALALLLVCAAMFTTQRLMYPASPHIELPNIVSRNPWTRAFLWARDYTPPDALFALDAKYVNEVGEDAQTFRATALRSALPDYSKDGGEAAITPTLAASWQSAAAAQNSLSTQLDTLRDARLRPFGVTWMVLHSFAATSHPCPYDNATIKICRVAE